ncbi:MAG: type II secretion system F family protein [Solirubrobacterales bacterium]|nr:type II secretion system F family protein [Solirubrobacterales bacterium]
MDGSAPAAPRLNLSRLAERIGGAMVGRLTRLNFEQMRRDLLGAGYYTVTAEAYLGYRIMATGTFTAFLAFLAISAPSALSILGLVIGGTLGWRVPLVIIQRRAAERRGKIDRDLPELIDLLVVSVEAGVGLGGALQMIAIRMSGPLGDELRLMLQEQSMGRSSDQSLGKLLERCDTPSVRSFVRSLQQGERLGVSIGSILRGLAVEMRTRRRQTAEERAQKAPVKILFPLVFLIFPAMFIVLLGPAVFAFKAAFGG